MSNELKSVRELVLSPSLIVDNRFSAGLLIDAFMSKMEPHEVLKVVLHPVYHGTDTLIAFVAAMAVRPETCACGVIVQRHNMGLAESVLFDMDHGLEE